MPSIIKPSRLSTMVQTEPVKGGGLMTVSAYLLFDFGAPRKLLSEQALWPMVQEQMPPEAIFDKGSLKPKGEFIIVGSALSPGDTPVTGMQVVARVGGREKRLSVFGDRYWRLTDQGVVMLPPVPFMEMSIDEAHAFGSPHFQANRRGKGQLSRLLLEGGHDAPLPNVENPAQHIRSLEDIPAPAHFGPIAADSPLRMRYAGTYDQNWIKNVAPLKPEDFNPLFYCDAPEDQRFDGYLKGDEDFAIAGMTRGMPVAGGQLPAMRARCFAYRPQDKSLSEIRLVPDTVVLFPNITKAVLIYRGIVRSHDAYGEDIGALMFALEHEEDAPRSHAYYSEIYKLRTNPEQAHKHALSDFQLMPEIDPAIKSARRAAKLEKARQQREQFFIDQHWALGKHLEDQNLPAGLAPPPDSSNVDDLPFVAMPTQEEIDNGELDLAELLDDVETLEKALWLKADTEMARAELIRKATVESLPPGVVTEHMQRPLVSSEHMARFPDLKLPDELAHELGDIDELLKNVAPKLSDQVDPDFAPEGIAAAQDEIDKLLSQVLGSPQPDPHIVDEQFELACARAMKLPEGSLLAQAKKELGGLDVGALNASLKPDDDMGDLDDMGALMADLPDSLADMRLDQIAAAPKSSGSTLDIALPDDPDFAGAVAELRPVLADTQAKAEKAIRDTFPNLIAADSQDPLGDLIAALDTPPAEAEQMRGLTLGEVAEKTRTDTLQELEDADVKLAEGMLSARQNTPAAIAPIDPLLPEVAQRLGDFVKQKLAQGHDFKGADLAGANLRNVNFSGLDLTNTLFERCDLTGANFSGTNLSGAVFSEAILNEADLSGCNLEKANLSKASFRNAVLDGVTATGNTIIHTDFTNARLRKARLSQLTVIECQLEGADFGGADVADAQILKGTANRMRADGATMNRVVFIEMPMETASYMGAHLNRVSFINVQAQASRFDESVFVSVSFNGSTDLSDSYFRSIKSRESAWNSTNLVRSCFVRAECEGALFNMCEMNDADLRLASLKNARLDRSTLVGSDLFGANLYAASLAGVNFTRASLRGSNLFLADLQQTLLGSCDLSGANLGMTHMERPTDA